MTDRQPVRTHELKSWPEFFEPVADREKRFEVRQADRDFQVGDYLLLKEFADDPRTDGEGMYTGRSVLCSVNYILEDRGEIIPGFLLQGFVIMDIDVLDSKLDEYTDEYLETVHDDDEEPSHEA